MRQTSRKILKRLLLIIVFVCFLLVFGYVSKYIDKIQSSEYRYYLDEGWTFSKNGEVVENVTLSEFTFDMACKDDVITISRIMPDTDIDNPLLVLEQYHSLLDVFIDGEKIYESGYREQANNEAVGYGLYTISLPHEYIGKELKVQLHVQQDNAFPNIEALWVENEVTYARNTVKRNILTYFTSIYLIIIGSVIIIICIAMWKFTKEYRRFLEIGIIALSMGLWIVSYQSAIKLYLDNIEVLSYFVYICGYFEILMIAVFFAESNIKRVFKIIQCVLLTAYSAIIVYMVIGELFNFRHVTEDIGILSYITNATMIFAVITILFGYEERDKAEKIMAGSVYLMALTGIVEIMGFNLEKYYGISIPASGFLLLGINLFVLMILNAYIINLKEFMKGEANKRVIERMAYTDQLTGLDNRAKCTEYFEEIDKMTECAYAIINFDMNGLKAVNDNMGHIIGDEYICRFARLLEEFFGDIGKIGRMGGDEFVAIIDEKNIFRIKDRLAQMLLKANEIQKQQTQYEMSFAYGYSIKAKSSERKSNEVYEAADKLMYDCKMEQKKGRS